MAMIYGDNADVLNIRQPDKVYLICGKTDLRKGIDGLAIVIKDLFDLDPCQPALFLFCGTRPDRFKGLYWENDGFVLVYKRIENGRLQWPRSSNEIRQLSSTQLERLLTGFSIDSTIKTATVANFY